jgi:putative membrane protein insertion efficiency factor
MRFSAWIDKGVAEALRAAIGVYRLLISPLLGQNCRFEPSCSAYASDALRRHGAAAGSVLAVRRICRCHPWSEGGWDPVPDTGSRPRILSSLSRRGV